MIAGLKGCIDWGRGVQCLGHRLSVWLVECGILKSCV